MDYFQAIEESRKSPAVLRVAKHNHLMLSWEIFVGNYHELKRVLEFHNNPDSIAELWSLRSRYKLEAVYRDVRRLLHNFVSSAKSLIDHTRNLHNEMIEDDRKISTYNSEIEKRFTKHGLTQFIQGLRNYFVHFSIPRVTSPNPMFERETRLYLLPWDLKRFDGWKSTAKAYLEGLEHKVDLLQIVDAYYNHVSEFHEWFESEFRRVHAEDQKVVDQFNEVARKFWVAHVPAMTFMIWSIQPPYKLGRVEECFAGVLNPNEWAQHSRLPLDPKVRGANILRILTEGGVDNQRLLERIKDVFAQAVV